MSASIPFVTGNPKIEMLTGSVQILRALVPAPRPEIHDSGDLLGETEVACLVDEVAPSKETHSVASDSTLHELAPSRVVAVLCVPARFVPTDLLSILAPFHDHTEAVRFLRHCDDPRQFMALVALNSKQRAGEVVAALDGTPYNSFESAPILVAFVRAVSFDLHNSNISLGGIVDNKTSIGRRLALDEEAALTVGDIARGPIEEWTLFAFLAKDGYLTSADVRALRISGRGAALLPDSADLPVDLATRTDLIPSRSQPEVVDFEDNNEELWAAAFPTRVQRVITGSPKHRADSGSVESLASSHDNKQSSGKAARSRTKSLSPQIRGHHQQEQSAQCVVCLEPLEGDGSQALLTTACNHSFHLRCLAQWSDAPCPVCRYHHNLASISSQCQWVGDRNAAYGGLAGSDSSSSSSSSSGERSLETTGERNGYGHRHRNSENGATACCGAGSGLLVCVICGFVGCARRRHARRHYEESLHAYALAMDTQQVWDFAGDGYVHRLVVSKGLGPVSHSSGSSGFDHSGSSGSGGGSSSGGGSGSSDEWSGTPKLVETTSPGSIVAASDARNALSAAASRFHPSADFASTLADEYGRPPVLGYRPSHQSPDRSSRSRSGRATDDTNTGTGSGTRGSSLSPSSPFHWQGSSLETASFEMDSSADALELDVHRKLEGLSFQYHELLAGQLEAQRAYFAQELDAVRRQRMRGFMGYHSDSLSASHSSGGSSGGGSGGGGNGNSSREDGLESGWPIPDGASLPRPLPPDALLAALAREKRALEQRLVAAKKRQVRAREERAEVDACNVQLADNVSVWQRKVEKAQAAALAVEAQKGKLLPPLQAKVADLMLKLDQTSTTNDASPNKSSSAAEDSEDPISPLPASAAEEEEEDAGEWAVSTNTTGSASKKKRTKKKAK